MMQLAVCLSMLLLLGIEFCIFGVAFCKIFRLEFRGYEIGFLGFFVYLGLFQIVALPLIFLQRAFHELVILWLIAAALVTVFVIVTGRKELLHLFQRYFAGIWRNRGLLLLAVVLLIGFCCWYQATQQFIGWDTTYYIGTVDTTVYTDSMYVYDGRSGLIEKKLDFRYALSAFYMHSALLCKLTGISGIIVQKYVFGTLCIFLHAGIIFAIGRRLFPQEEKHALFMTGLVFAMHLGFHTQFSASDFLLIRGYESKGFCANVVITAVFYAILCLWENWDKKAHWYLAFMICFSSVPISMSSLLIVPALFVIAMSAECLIKKKGKILWRTFWCVIPNGVYLILYFLYTMGLQVTIRK